MIAVRLDTTPKSMMPFWLMPDQTGLSSSPERWTFTDARQFVDENRKPGSSWAVYSIRGFYHKKIYPRKEL